MYYDEYEISMGREIAFCRRVIKDLKADLSRKEQLYEMTTDQFLKIYPGGPSSEKKREMDRWHSAHRQLLEWERRLHDYKEALEVVKREG